MVRCLYFRLNVFELAGQKPNQFECCYDANKAQNCRYTATSRAFPVLGPVQYTKNRSPSRYNASKPESSHYRAIIVGSLLGRCVSAVTAVTTHTESSHMLLQRFDIGMLSVLGHKSCVCWDSLS